MAHPGFNTGLTNSLHANSPGRQREFVPCKTLVTQSGGSPVTFIADSFFNLADITAGSNVVAASTEIINVWGVMGTASGLVGGIVYDGSSGGNGSAADLALATELVPLVFTQNGPFFASLDQPISFPAGKIPKFKCVLTDAGAQGYITVLYTKTTV